MAEADADAASALPERLGEFRITGLLGEGAYGTVYAAERQVQGQVQGAAVGEGGAPRRLALKVLRADILPGERQRKQFLQEATLLAAIDHPGVVKVLGFGLLPDDRPYLAMERLDGESLSERLRRGALAPGEAFALFAQLADALAALHARGLLHRDVKPENVYLRVGAAGGSGAAGAAGAAGVAQAVLFDFGIAKGDNAPLSTMTQDGAVRGTPAYMAPERFFGAPSSIGSEIYELAVTLYAMLCGRLPWNDNGDPESRLSPLAPAAIGVALPAELEAELLRALSTRAEKRPASVRELAARIAAAAGQGELGGPRRTLDLPAAAEAGGALDAVLTPRSAATASARLLANQPTTGAGGAPGPGAGGPLPTEKTRRRSRWSGAVLALAGLALAGGVGAFVGRVAWRDPSASTSARRDAGPAPDPRKNEKSDNEKNDEKNDNDKRDEPPLPPPGPRRDALTRRVPTSIWKHHPRDTAVLAALSWTQVLAADPVKKAIVARKGDKPPRWLARAMRTCGFDPLIELEWLSFGVGADPGGQNIDLIVAGRWTRDEIEPCVLKLLDSPLSHPTMRRAGRLTFLDYAGKGFWLGWLDDHTMLFSTRAGADQAWVEARLDGKDSAEGATPLVPLRKRTDESQTFWLTALPATVATGPFAPGLPAPTWMAGGIHLTHELRGDLRWSYDRPEDTKVALATAQALLDDAKKDGIANFVIGKSSVTAEGHELVFHIEIDATGTEAVVHGTIEALAKQLGAL